MGSKIKKKSIGSDWIDFSKRDGVGKPRPALLDRPQ